MILFVILEKFTFTKHAYNPNVFIKPTTYSQSLNCMYIHVIYYKFIDAHFGSPITWAEKS